MIFVMFWIRFELFMKESNFNYLLNSSILDILFYVVLFYDIKYKNSENYRRWGTLMSRPDSRIHDRHIGKVPFQGSIHMRTQTYIQAYPSNNSIRVQRSTNNKNNFNNIIWLS